MLRLPGIKLLVSVCLYSCNITSFSFFQACMLTFYPEFDCDSQDNYEMIILLDMSNSMSSEDVISVKKIAIVLLNSISSNASFNIITYGSSE